MDKGESGATVDSRGKEAQKPKRRKRRRLKNDFPRHNMTISLDVLILKSEKERAGVAETAARSAGRKEVVIRIGWRGGSLIRNPTRNRAKQNQRGITRKRTRAPTREKCKDCVRLNKSTKRRLHRGGMAGIGQGEETVEEV